MCLIGASAIVGGSVEAQASNVGAQVGPFGQVPTNVVPGYTKGFPASIAAIYEGGHDIVGPSAYRAWKAEKPPWIICFNNSYLGNTWRAGALTGFVSAMKKYEKLGLVKKYYVTNSNETASTQIAQMNDQVHVDHCSGIVTIPTGTSTMDQAIKAAYDAGVPVVGDLGPTTTPYEENMDANFYLGALQGAQWLAREIHGHGNIVDVEGIPGETLTNYYEVALRKVLKANPGIHLLGTAEGDYTDTKAKTAMLTFLGTHPQPIAGVYEEGGMGQGVVAALQQVGRPLVPMPAVIGSGNMIAIWHQLLKEHKPAPFYAPFTDPPIFVTQLAVNILVRILEGQHPKNMTIYYPTSATAITTSNLNSWWNPKLTPNTTLWPEPPKNPLPEALLNQYFMNGKDPALYKK
jgi:ribose transport system substrate-binding protein